MHITARVTSMGTRGIVLAALSFLCANPEVFSSDASLVAKGDPSKIAALEIKVSNDPKNVTLHYLLANEYVTRNDYGNAILEYHICVELQPESPAGKYAAEALARLHKYDKGGPSLNESRAAANRILGTSATGVGGSPGFRTGIVPGSGGSLGRGTGTMSFTSIANSGQQITPPTSSAMIPSPNAPKIVSLDCVSSPPGQPLTITGSGFGVPRNELTVTIQGQLALVVSASSTTIVCIIPEIEMPKWNAPVVVRTTYGVSNTETLNIQTRRIPAL